MVQQYLTVSEISRKFAISRARVLQLLAQDGWREQCIEKRANTHVSVLLVPEKLFSAYVPNLLRQQAGKTRKRQKKRRKINL